MRYSVKSISKVNYFIEVYAVDGHLNISQILDDVFFNVTKVRSLKAYPFLLRTLVHSPYQPPIEI